MAGGDSPATGVAEVRLQRPIDPTRDHLRGGGVADTIAVVVYGDLLCPYCHGGSRAHADDPRLLPDFAPRSAFLAARPEVPRPDGEVTRAEWINRTCARCHQVLFSRYPFTWEGGLR